jgi:FixJ family two-component response regulator
LSNAKKELIVVVDDDQSLVEATVSLMESVGFNAEGFLSADDFLSSPRLRCTACLILDVRMPRMGGLELQRLLAVRNHHIPIIFITANGGEDVSAKALAAGAVEFLHKPFSQESLLRAVRSALAISTEDSQ